MGRPLLSISKLREVIKKAQSVETDMNHWTLQEKETCKTIYGCDILVENGTYAEVCTKEAPNDAYIIKYIVDDKLCSDLTKGSKVRLFDMYWDKFRENFKSIDFGYGRVNPRLWGYQSPKTKRRK
jgi:hypothetical protein